MDTRRLQLETFEPLTTHEDAVDIEGLEDLFQWASEVVADSTDPRTRRTRENKIRRNVLEVIQRNKEIEARERVGEEVTYLQKRVIALLQIVTEKMEETSTLKQILVMQFFALNRVAQLEDEVKQLQAMTWYRDEAEAERKHLMDALSKVKQERDFLDELLTANEAENVRLARVLQDTRSELDQIRSRKWWHGIVNFVRKATQPA